MAAYSSPDRRKAISILRNSASAQAEKLGLPLAQFVAEQAAIGIGALDAALAAPGELNALYQAARDRLAADPDYVFEFRQDQVDASFNQELDKLHAGLHRSPRALRLVDPAKLRALLNNSALPDDAITPQLVIDAVHRVQVVSPFSVGFEAYSKGNRATPLVVIGYGSSDLMFHASHLIVAYGMQETSPGISNPRSLREHPEEYAQAVAELENLLKRSEAGAAAAASPVTQAADRYGGLVYPIAAHALSFFVLHELGHLLVKSESPYHEELACDEFAACILGSSDDDRCWLGIAMGAQLLSIALRQSHAEWRSATYPGASYRLSNVTDAMRLAGARLQAPVDYLLDIPSRVYEQDVFETDTRRLVFFSYAGALLARWGDTIEASAVLQLALAVLDYATRLPSVLEHPQLTCWNDESGQRAYVVTLEPYRALLVAGWMLADAAPHWEQLAAEAALLLITTVGHDPPPSEEAAGLFLALACHKKGAARRDHRSRDYLKRIGAITENPKLGPRSTGVAVFYHGPSPGDGDIPIAGDPYARRQTGALLAAWQEYSRRPDRESPWYMQRGVKALEGWPSP